MASASTNPTDGDLSLSNDQVSAIVQKHVKGNPSVRKVTEIANKGFSYTSKARTYVVDLSPLPQNPATSSCFITIQRSAPAPDPGSSAAEDVYQINTLPTIHKILSQIRTHTDIPIPDPILDTTHTLIPFDFLLSPPSPITSDNIIPLSLARKSGLMSAEDIARVDLQIGQFLGQLHSGVQNDWFGQPLLGQPKVPSYSWQESFTLLLETLLSEFQAAGVVEIPYEDIRRYLSRAIGFFLFDDVEVPSLVWLTGSESDIYIALPSHPATKTQGIAAILPNVAHALWGDPLLECFFMPPAPSAAVLEAYTESGGGTLIAFARQKTKRIWYSLLLALIILRERKSGHADKSEADQQWALNLIQESVEALAHAPNY